MKTEPDDLNLQDPDCSRGCSQSNNGPTTSVIERGEKSRWKTKRARKGKKIGNDDYSRKVDCRSRDATFVSPGHVATRRLYRG